MLERLEPRPPTPLPTNPPSPVLRPAPAMPETPAAPVTPGGLQGTKKPWLSSGIVAALVGIFWFIADPIAGMFGIEIGFLKDGFQFERDAVPFATLVVALWGRWTARKRIG